MRGTVRNANGQPLAGINVYGYGTNVGGGTVQTDGTGVYTMPLVVPGSMHLAAFDPQGFYQRKPHPDSGSYGDGTSLEIAPSVTVTANFTLRPAGRIQGQVFVDGDPTSSLRRARILPGCCHVGNNRAISHLAIHWKRYP